MLTLSRGFLYFLYTNYWPRCYFNLLVSAQNFHAGASLSENSVKESRPPGSYFIVLSTILKELEFFNVYFYVTTFSSKKVVLLLHNINIKHFVTCSNHRYGALFHPVLLGSCDKLLWKNVRELKQKRFQSQIYNLVILTLEAQPGETDWIILTVEWLSCFWQEWLSYTLSGSFPHFGQTKLNIHVQTYCWEQTVMLWTLIMVNIYIFFF